MAPGSLVKLDDYRQVAPRGAVDILMRIGGAPARDAASCT